MNTESMSLPIAPATGCCSDTTPNPTSGIGEAAQPLATSESCCQSGSHGAGQSAVTGSSCDATPVTAPVATEADAAAGEGPDDATLIDALRTVIDPELMINIVDLGLVYSINHSDRKALVEMTLTSPACPAGPQIISQAKIALEKINGIDTAEIKLTMSPPWTPDRMTDEARDQLGIF